MKRKLRTGCLLVLLGFLFPAGAHGEEAVWKESPFLAERGSKPDSKPGPGRGTLQVQGILWDPEAPTAIVDGRVIGVGDSVGSWKVAEIRKDNLLLASPDGQTREIYVQ